MSDLVTLIMPVWQPRADWLRAAVTSALDESACDIELLVVDDGCPSPVAPLLEDLDDPRLRVMRIEHGGPYVARNAALAAARGNWIRFVDSDDIVEPGSTGRMLAVAREHGGEVLPYGATVMTDEQLTRQTTHTSELEGHIAELCVQCEFDVFVVSILFPRSVLERSGPWEEVAFRVAGDWDYVLRALEQAPVRPLGEVVTYYRRHATSATNSAKVGSGAHAGRLVVDRYFDRHPEQRRTALERNAYSRLHLTRARAHFWGREPLLCARSLALAARHDPVAVLGAAAQFGADRAGVLVTQARTRARRGRPPQG